MPDSQAQRSAPPNPSASPRRKARTTKIVLWVIGLLVAIPAIALVILLNYDWNKARPWLNARTSEAIGRPFAINGDLSLTWEKQITGPAATWRDHIPWPHLVAKDVHVSNPEGMPARDTASVSELSFSLNPFALLRHTIQVPVLQFQSPAVDLLRKADGSNNWTFHHQEKPSPWTLDLERVVFTKGVVHVADALEKADVTADIDTLDSDPTYGVSWKLRGTFKDAPVAGGGKAGAVLSLKNQDTPFPIKAEFHSGATHVSAEGTVTRPAKLAAIDLRLKLGAPSMARLYNFTGVLLPETPAFTTEGRLIGTLDAKSSRWTYDKFKGKVGGSDIAGHLEFQTGKPRGMLTGNVVSHLLRFSDLGPIIGADSNASKTARGVAPVQPAGKVLPVEKFRTDRWKTVDVDVKYSADQIVRDKQLPITKLSTHLVMNAGVLTLNPLNFSVAGGNMVSNIKLDGSGREGKDAIKATAKVTARHLQIKQLFPTIEKMQATVGEVNGDAQLSSTGSSVATLLAGSNGEIKTLINQGSVSKLLLEEMGLNVGNIILTKMFGDKDVKLNCMATDFAVTNGLMQTRTFVVDTDEAVITADGTINLADEQLNLTLRPETKSLRIFSLRAPLHVTGPFNAPRVGIDKGVVALKAGGAVALAAVAAPAAALLPLINAGPGENSECGKLLAAARVKPVAPPPPAHAKR
ncbi:AsmA family protein [Massilia sp. R2A-15]|uniref:AsmA family protein n=1 Tax=Massilia sp. R2A-15 TaxID=3064278 RepID=UPI00273234AD|nr:AsmA family protein [Massilia sp. R2A-15]WLI90434.1 AsmA family protein [Massilia sp. R2A-15]